MTRQQAIDIVIMIQNRPENLDRDIVTFCGFCDSTGEILEHAVRNGWRGK